MHHNKASKRFLAAFSLAILAPLAFPATAIANPIRDALSQSVIALYTSSMNNAATQIGKIAVSSVAAKPINFAKLQKLAPYDLVMGILPSRNRACDAVLALIPFQNLVHGPFPKTVKIFYPHTARYPMGVGYGKLDQNGMIVTENHCDYTAYVANY